MSFERMHDLPLAKQGVIMTPAGNNYYNREQTIISGTTPTAAMDMSGIHRSSIASISSSKGNTNKRIIKMSLVRGSIKQGWQQTDMD